MMRWTRFSFFYLVGYLTFGGLGLVFAPAFALQLSGATGSYTPSRDPLFLVLTAIVGLGMVLTATGLLADRRASGQPHH